MTDAEIAGIRDRIAALDRHIVECVAERVDHARTIGSLKHASGDATLDPAREAAVIRQAVMAARDHDLPEEPVRELFWTLMELCRSAQMEER